MPSPTAPPAPASASARSQPSQTRLAWLAVLLAPLAFLTVRYWPAAETPPPAEFARPDSGLAAELPAYDQLAEMQGAPVAAGAPWFRPAIVREVHQAPNYTYLHLMADVDDAYWIASPPLQTQVGDRVGFVDVIEVEDFHSPTLERSFPTIYFVRQSLVVDEYDRLLAISDDPHHTQRKQLDEIAAGLNDQIAPVVDPTAPSPSERGAGFDPHDFDPHNFVHP